MAKILIDTGIFVALFDSQDHYSKTILKLIQFQLHNNKAKSDFRRRLFVESLNVGTDFFHSFVLIQKNQKIKSSKNQLKIILFA